MKIKSFVMTRIKPMMSMRTPRRILRIMTRKRRRRRRKTEKPILTMVCWMPCLMNCLALWVRPGHHPGEFLLFLRDHRDQEDHGGLQLQLSLGLKGEDFTIASWEVDDEIFLIFSEY